MILPSYLFVDLTQRSSCESCIDKWLLHPPHTIFLYFSRRFEVSPVNSMLAESLKHIISLFMARERKVTCKIESYKKTHNGRPLICINSVPVAEREENKIRKDDRTTVQVKSINPKTFFSVKRSPGVANSYLFQLDPFPAWDIINVLSQDLATIAGPN